MWEPAPIDSYDCYAMGLRAPRCNGCAYAKLKYELGDKFLTLKGKTGWTDVYELDAEPEPGQSEPKEYEGRPIKYIAGFMSIEHSDECHHWKPPNQEAMVRDATKLSTATRISKWKGDTQ